MSQIESSRRPTSIDSRTAVSRWITHRLLSDTILRYKIVSDENNSIDAARKFQQAGGAIVAISNHPSRTEPPRLMHFILTQPILRDRKIVAPISRHSVNMLYTGLGKINDITLTPIVTQKTLAKEKYQNLKLNEGLTNYIQKSARALRDGETVVLMPQGERASCLGQPQNLAIELLMLEAKKKGIENYAFLIVGFGIDNIDDYSSQLNKHNYDKSYKATVGSFLTANQVWTKASQLAETSERIKKPVRFLGQVIFDELRKVVPESYR